MARIRLARLVAALTVCIAAAPAHAVDVEVTAFGARCDGKSNDQAALAAAAQHVGEAGGGTIRLPAGTCVHDFRIDLRSKTALIGQGWDRTVLKRTRPKIASIRIHGKADAPVRDVLVADLRIVGVSGFRQGYQKGAHAVEIQHADGVTIRQVWASQIGAEAFYAAGRSRRIEFLFNRATDIGHNGFNFNGSMSDSKVVGNQASDVWANGFEGAGENLLVADNNFERSRLWGLALGNLFVKGWVSSAVRVENNTLVGSTGKAAESGGILLQAGARDMTVVNNTIADNAGFGIFISGRKKFGKLDAEMPGNLRIERNTIRDNGGGRANTAGIQVSGPIPDVVIRQNRIYGSRRDGHRQRIGIRTVNSDDTTTIVDNLAYDHEDANYEIDGKDAAHVPKFVDNKSGYGNRLRTVSGGGGASFRY
jgi:hypothetical protein